MADDGGLKRFQQRMNAIPVAVRDAVKPALMKGGYEIADAIEALAPEDDGDLKNSVAVTPGGQSTPPYSQPGGANIVPENQVAVTAGNTSVRYAHIVEHGSTKMEAQPFFWPGFRLARRKATNRIKTAIRKAVKEAR